MHLQRIGITSPGDMGQGVAMRLKACGFGVYAALAGRSARTAELAREAGLDDCSTLERLVETCDAVFSVLNPAAALDNARDVSAAMRVTGRRIVYVDCNAIAPQTGRDIEKLVQDAGGTYIDAGIIGPPPRGKAKTKLYVSGAAAQALAEAIRDDQLQVRVVSARTGDASALKMCYAAMTKGSLALGMELLMAAQRLGVAEQLDTELKDTQSELYDSVVRRSTSMAFKAYRWVPEMREIAKTFEGAALTPRMLQGAADMYEVIAATPLGRESPEEARAKNRSGSEIVRKLADGTN